MNAYRVLSLVALFLSLSVASVYANGYTTGIPLLGTTGVPALAAPSLFSGVLTVIYPDGSPVVLSSSIVNLAICAGNSTLGIGQSIAQLQRNGNSTGCFTARANLKQSAPGTYTYSFTPPSLNGVATIYVQSGGLADDNGKVFPSVDTSIGTYAYTPSTPSSSVPATPATAPAGTPPSQIKQAVNMSPTVTPTTQSPIVAVVAALTVLAVAGCLFIFLPRKR